MYMYFDSKSTLSGICPKIITRRVYKILHKGYLPVL